MAIHDGAPTDLYLVTETRPDSCGIANGWIKLDSLIPGDLYALSYSYLGATYTQTVTATASWQATLTALDSGSYTDFTAVKLTATPYHCPYNVIAGPVVLSDPPNPDIPAISTNSPVCVGGTLTINAISSTGVSYLWSEPGDLVLLIQILRSRPVTSQTAAFIRYLLATTCVQAQIP